MFNPTIQSYLQLRSPPLHSGLFIFKFFFYIIQHKNLINVSVTFPFFPHDVLPTQHTTQLSSKELLNFQNQDHRKFLNQDFLLAQLELAYYSLVLEIQHLHISSYSVLEHFPKFIYFHIFFPLLHCQPLKGSTICLFL